MLRKPVAGNGQQLGINLVESAKLSRPSCWGGGGGGGAQPSQFNLQSKDKQLESQLGQQLDCFSQVELAKLSYGGGLTQFNLQRMQNSESAS